VGGHGDDDRGAGRGASGYRRPGVCDGGYRAASGRRGVRHGARPAEHPHRRLSRAAADGRLAAAAGRSHGAAAGYPCEAGGPVWWRGGRGGERAVIRRALAALARGRRLAEALMVDMCAITRAAGQPGAIDPETGERTPPAATTVYSGQCKVQTYEAHE